MIIELTTVDSSDGSSSGVRANEDLRCPFFPNGILVPLPEKIITITIRKLDLKQ